MLIIVGSDSTFFLVLRETNFEKNSTVIAYFFLKNMMKNFVSLKSLLIPC